MVVGALTVWNMVLPPRRDFSADDFELDNCGCVRPGSVEHEKQLEGRGGDAAERL